MNSRATANGIGFRTDKNDSVAAIASSCIMPRPIIYIYCCMSFLIAYNTKLKKRFNFF